MTSELAYVFWHWPRPDVPVARYEESLYEFHTSLRSSKTPGLVDAFSFRVGGLPWGPGGSLYEDWYVVQDFSALGTLNEAAVSGGNRQSHDAVAGHYMKGAGGVLKRVTGDLDPRDSAYSTWIDKPSGKTYLSYYDELGEHVGGLASSGLWRRQMVLGPSPQFCMHSRKELGLPASYRPFQAKLDLVAQG